MLTLSTLLLGTALGIPPVPTGRHVVVPYQVRLHQAPKPDAPFWMASARPRIGGTTWRVTRSAHGWLQITPAPRSQRCYPGLVLQGPNLLSEVHGVNLRLYVKRADLALLTARPVVLRTDKGAELRLASGLRVWPAGKGRYRVEAPEVRVTLPLPADSVGHHAATTAKVDLAHPDGFSFWTAPALAPISHRPLAHAWDPRRFRGVLPPAALQYARYTFSGFRSAPPRNHSSLPARRSESGEKCGLTRISHQTSAATFGWAGATSACSLPPTCDVRPVRLGRLRSAPRSYHLPLLGFARTLVRNAG